MYKIWKKFKDDKSGVTAIEFALVGSVFILLLLSIIELGRYFFTWNSLQYSMEQTTRYVLVNADAPIDTVKEYAVSQMPPVLIDPDNLSVTVNYMNVSDIGFIELIGNYEYNFLSPIVPGSPLSIDMLVSARMPIQ